MEAHASQVLAAGATFTDDGKAVRGGSYVVSVASLQEARDFVDNDPFTKAGLRAFVTIQPWIKAVFDGQFNIPTDDSPLFANRSEEHTSELQSLMRISYAVFFLKKKNSKAITL